MSQYWLDFTDDTVGNAPAGMTKRWVTANLSLTVQTDAGAPSGKSVRVAKTVLNRAAATIDAVDSDSNRANLEVRMLIRTPSSYSGVQVPFAYLLGRGSGSSGSETGYAGGLLYESSSDRRAEMREYASGTLTANIGGNTTTPSAYADNTIYWLRFRANGNTLTRGIAPAATPETETWTVSATDSTISAAGWVGILAPSADAWDILAIGVGTNGDAAPTSGSDSTAPTLSSAGGTTTGATTATAAVTTNEATGTLYAVATTSSTKPTKTQVKAGQNNGGTAAAWAANQAVSSSGAKSFSATGLSASTAYYFHFMHEDSSANQSDVATSSSFTTDTPDTTAPTLTTPTATATGALTASGTVSTNEANGTLYYRATANSSESATMVKAGSSKSVTATGEQSVSITGLASATAYYVHYLHRDASGNDSTVASSTQITTTEEITIRADYERSSVNLTGSSVTGVGSDAVITIKPRVQESEVIGTSKWLEPSARIDNINGIRPTFKFIDYSLYHGGGWGSRKPMFSYDRETWYSFSTCAVGASEITFRHDSNFSANTVYIGRARQMSVAQIGSWLDGLATLYPSIVTPAQSAVGFTPTLTAWPGQSFIAAEFSAQTNELSATIPAVPFYAAKIGNGSTMAILSAGVHAGENHSDYVLRSTVEYLCGSSTEAQALRERYTILLYPIINAPGRAGGGWRGSFTQGNSGWDDANRHWSTTNSNLEIIDKPKAAMVIDLNSKTPSWAIDFHAAYDQLQAMYEGDAVEEVFRTRLGTYTGYTFANMGPFVADALGRWYRTTLGATLATILEFCSPTPVSDARIAEYGEGIVGAVEKMSTDKDIPWEWPVPIDLVFSGTAPATLLSVQVWNRVPKQTDVENLY